MVAASLRDRVREEEVPGEIRPVVARLNQLLALLENTAAEITPERTGVATLAYFA